MLTKPHRVDGGCLGSFVPMTPLWGALVTSTRYDPNIWVCKSVPDVRPE